MTDNIRVTVWNEFRHEKDSDEVKELYPDGMHKVIADHLNKQDGIDAGTATLDEPEHGLTDDVLAKTDVLLWWGHVAHHKVKDEVAEKVVQRIWDGMGFVPLHSAHMSKPFRKLMGTHCMLKWREIGEKERLWVMEPGHPICRGLPEYIELPQTEMYGERFEIPDPDKIIFISWFAGGEVFRSGCCFHRGDGKIFYFRPGHETYPIYYNDTVLKVISNGVRWAAPVGGPKFQLDQRPPIEDIKAAE